MSTEILPSGTDGYDISTTKEYVYGVGETTTIKKTGDVTQIEALYEADIETIQGGDSSISSLTFNSRNGRGETTILYEPAEDDPEAEEDGAQELVAIDVIRPIYTAPYFKSLDYTQVGDVRRTVADGVREVDAGWVDLQKVLFKHLIMGRDTYYETAYIFRKTFKTSSSSALNRSASDINTVVALPALSSAMQNMIDSLPVGEWLKRPTQVRNMSKSGYDVSEEYLWAPIWSVVYGGTFTGEAIV